MFVPEASNPLESPPSSRSWRVDLAEGESKFVEGRL